MVKVRKGQNMFDITVQEFGQIDNVVEVSAANDISVSDVLVTNDDLVIDSDGEGDNDIKKAVIEQGLSLNNREGENPATPPPVGPLEDLDGNEYTTVIIGNQEWTIENLRVTQYADGSPIPKVTGAVNWAAAADAYCALNDNDVNIPQYGLYYNHEAVSNASGLCYLLRGGVQEAGWRIPTKTDFETLQAFLGGSAVAGGHVKSTGVTLWNSPNNADNSSGFTLYPGGARLQTGAFTGLGSTGIVWGITPTLTAAWGIDCFHTITNMSVSAYIKASGNNVRCVRTV